MAVARKLLGCRLRLGRLEAKIIETEAYLGTTDAASHAAPGPRPRNQPMFGPVGHLYVYRSYGIHHCLNLVAHPPGGAGAVLIRALEPIRGQKLMEARRGRGGRELCSGPGKLCQAFAIDMTYNQQDLIHHPDIRLMGGPPEYEIRRGPRVGISKAVDLPYRFWLAGNPHVSRGARS